MFYGDIQGCLGFRFAQSSCTFWGSLNKDELMLWSLLGVPLFQETAIPCMQLLGDWRVSWPPSKTAPMEPVAATHLAIMGVT